LFGFLTSPSFLQAATLPEQLTADDFHPVSHAKAQIGQLLFFDPILSGNKNISCGTCHSPKLGTSDGLSLGIGEGGTGIGPDRTAGIGDNRIRKRIPRNAPGLWNLGAREVTIMFHDGRLSISDIYGNGFNSPAQEWLPSGLDSILAAQALFPLTAQFEMAGNPKENEIAGAAHDRIDAVWPIIAKRIRNIPEYANMFVAAFDDVAAPLEINISHIANAIGAFEALEWQSFDSHFDNHLASDNGALSKSQKRGMGIFFGKGQCSTCHSGKLFTDHRFHALALPHFGPGRTRNFDPYVRDVGRMGETDRLDDAYRFRTPSLRNIGLTAPYGHNGAYPTLRGIIDHHLNPLTALQKWDQKLADLPAAPWLAYIDFISFEDPLERLRLRNKVDIEEVELSGEEIEDLVAFLHSLTGTHSINGRLGKPERVPSGLEVDQ
jgi:cytochrome c peroxidase